ncbi:outer membrane protein assembly factor BamB family protein [Fulvivirga sediminis]|uniref:PQQ-binding-like beta-propeller repeat protein n=1 Tax=Fulvivirga sediminis TaxID=2803949 RepID=A0A937K1Q2_9BACT|nr:PQQ-binding-like beta-propeller repeat protein [Fulvivirga sediminis]MBL3656937.1 PQQ-binding-like beta-propeller repeat protein [Fulvivirga sediminis]
MKKSLFFNLSLLMIFLSSISYSQEKLWKINLKAKLNNVSWIEQANNGVIIAAGDKGLMALDNSTGEEIWFNSELKAVDRSSFQNVEGLPLFFAEYYPLAAKKRALIINASNGDIVYSTQTDGYSIKAYHIIPEEACILFELVSEGERNLMKFSLKNWKSEWTVNLGKIKGLTNKLNNLSGLSFITQGPLFSQNEELIIAIKSEVYVINKNTGSLIWDYSADKDITTLVHSKLNNSLYVGVKNSKRLTVLDPATGKDITPGKLKLKGSMLDIVQDEAGHLVLVETEGFNLIDPKSGELIWKKSYKIEYLDEVIPYEDGFIAIGKDEKNGSISYVDKDGKKVWDSKVKGYAYYATPTQSGILYVSTQRSNILSYKDGKDVWDKDVKFKSIPAVTYDEKENKVILFENKNGYKFDLTTGVITVFAEDVELEEVKKSTPLEAEYLPAGYFITADQHASLLSPDGKVVYTKYFPPVTSVGGLTNLAQKGLAVAGVDIDIEGSLNNLKTLKSLGNGAYRSAGDQNEGTSSTSVVAGLYVGSDASTMATVFEITKTRYYNSRNSKDHKFILTKQKNEDSGRNFIFAINKSTGNIDYKIELIDKTPSYIVDEVDKRVFVNENNQEITCYKL